MKVLWIINTPFGLHLDLMGKESAPGSGGWYRATYEIQKQESGIQLHIVALSQTDKIVSKADEYGNVFYLLPGSYTRDDKHFDSERNRSFWREIRRMVEPDIVQLWGTEFQHGLCALRQMGGIPQVVYMQGVMTEIAHYYKAGIDDKTIRRHQTLRSAILKRDSIFTQQRLYYKMARTEEEILRQAKNVIVENDWCESICRSIIGKDARVFRSKLPISETFREYHWDKDNYEPHTIFTNAGGYVIKGHHILFEALRYVIEKHPDVKVRIPGGDSIAVTREGWMNNLKRDDYSNYLRHLIKKNHLEGHIEWMGGMKQSDMAAAMSRSHVYVMCSAIENHSSSLIEAMMIGMPCIASFVGGVGDVATHKHDCMLYRYDDTLTLAAMIDKLFVDGALCNELSRNASIISEKRGCRQIKEELKNIYGSLIK